MLTTAYVGTITCNKWCSEVKIEADTKVDFLMIK